MYIVYINTLFQAETAGVHVELVDNSFLKLRGEIKGPPDTPFDGGKYILDITIPETYPFNPPKVSKIYICLVFCGGVFVADEALRIEKLT